MKAKAWHLAHDQPVYRFFDPADHSDLHAGFGPLLQDAQDQVVAHLFVVDQQLLAGALDERGQHFAR